MLRRLLAEELSSEVFTFYECSSMSLPMTITLSSKISQFQSIVLYTFLIIAFPTALTLVIATRLKYHKSHTCVNIHTSHTGFNTYKSHTGFTTYISHTGCSTQNSQIGFIHQKIATWASQLK